MFNSFRCLKIIIKYITVFIDIRYYICPQTIKLELGNGNVRTHPPWSGFKLWATEIIIIKLYCHIQRALHDELECSLALTHIVPIYTIK